MRGLCRRVDRCLVFLVFPSPFFWKPGLKLMFPSNCCESAWAPDSTFELARFASGYLGPSYIGASVLGTRDNTSLEATHSARTHTSTSRDRAWKTRSCCDQALGALPWLARAVSALVYPRPRCTISTARGTSRWTKCDACWTRSTGKTTPRRWTSLSRGSSAGQGISTTRPAGHRRRFPRKGSLGSLELVASPDLWSVTRGRRGLIAWIAPRRSRG